MVAELEVLSEWIPDQMQPGTIFVLENAGHIGEKFFIRDNDIVIRKPF